MTTGLRMAMEGIAKAHQRPPNTSPAPALQVLLITSMVLVGSAAALGQDVDATQLTNSIDIEPPATSGVRLDQALATEPFVAESAQTDSATSTIEDALMTRGSITFRKTSLQEVVFLLSDLWGVNIVAGEKVEGTVSGVFNDAPLRDVLSAILTSSGYGFTAAGNSLIVMPIDEVGTGSPDFRSRILTLMISDESQRTSTIEAAKMLLSPRGQIQSFGGNRVLVIDSQDRIDRVEEMFAGIGAGGRPRRTGDARRTGNVSDNGDPSSQNAAALGNGGVWAPLRIAYFTPQYTEASEMRESLAAALGAADEGAASSGENGESGSNNNDGPIVAVFKEENRLMVKGTPDELRLAAEAFQQLDIPRAQVRITTMIYDVALKELEELGVDWSRNFRLNTVDGTPLSEFAGNASDALGFSTGGAAGAASIGLRTLSNNFDAGAFLNALDSTTEAKLLADPSITTADRREASIKIVQRIPVIAAAPTQQSGVVFAQVEFEDAGIILKVTPRISNDGTIEMKVQPEYSVVTDFIDNNPVIDSRTAETTVRVKNGHMFVLGGLRQKTINETVGGVPWLRDVKYVGKLFQSHTTEVRESELIVFLRPELICPTYNGTPRERVAYNVTSNQLDRIAYASCCPQTPKCCDPKCPNHHPRCRINGGSRELDMIGDCGITPFALALPMETSDMVSGGTVVSDNIISNPIETHSAGTEQDSYFQLHDAGGPYPDAIPPVNVAPYESMPPITQPVQ